MTTPKSDTPRRFHMVNVTTADGETYGDMREKPTGAYVLYSDHARELAAAVAQRDKMAPLLNDYSQQIDDQRRRAESAEATLAESVALLKKWLQVQSCISHEAWAEQAKTAEAATRAFFDKKG